MGGFSVMANNFFVEMYNANGAAGVFYEGKSDGPAKEVLEHTIHIVRSCGGSCVIRYKHADAKGAVQFLNGEQRGSRQSESEERSRREIEKPSAERRGLESLLEISCCVTHLFS